MATKDFGLGLAVPRDSSEIGYVVHVKVIDEQIVVNFPIPSLQNPIARIAHDFLHCQMYSGEKLTVMHYRPNTGADGTQCGQHGVADAVFAGAYLEEVDLRACKNTSCISPSLREFLDRPPLTRGSTVDSIKVDMPWCETLISKRTTPAGTFAVELSASIRSNVNGVTLTEQVSLEHKSDDVTPIVDRFTFLLSIHQLSLILTRHIENAHSFSCEFLEKEELIRCQLFPPVQDESKPQHTFGSRRITLKETGLDLETLVANWIPQAHKIAPSLGIFERWLTTRANDRLNETDLFMLIQSHEIFFNRLYGDDGKLSEKLKKLIGSWLGIFGFTNAEQTCVDISNTRNWFTHFNPKYDKQEKERSYANMDSFGMLLQITYPALLLQLLKAPDDSVRAYLARAAAEHASYF